MIRPFIKWAGGKTRVLPDLLPLLPKGDCLIEPFVGGASVFLNTDYSHYVLADINGDLIELYQAAKDDPDELIWRASTLFRNGNSAQAYEENRRRYNRYITCPFDPARPALFLYLNRHCFNGLCRYNRKGEFNVPFGRYKKVYFPEVEIRLFAEKARDTKAVFLDAHFSQTLKYKAKAGRVIYCDPPYLPASDTSNFTQYHFGSFTTDNHQQLADELMVANRKTGCAVVISNSDTPATREIYQGFEFHKIAVQRSISANAISRGAAKEVIGVLKAGRFAGVCE
ncbi:Dam family site-specific DNA-(adenine-N6)-methyltransferase [Pectobacterium carotovorum]|uniref:Dam family site-specific DNA-(adenine-N6)-methyltransferase n=1 Tax=Pectobacterium TaxID=122277 RepID=UPI000CD15F6B|nr:MULTISPECIES: Dam family site-specific DNA-(adenine-N6)-methyltransferase [Pectobacterium]MCA6969222.1 Dam family site-specific DNA-(adenine-N6)-methyltransferase [Pectobacterium carotovorum]POE18462.1 adenine methylase [Pectobacterium odoriferum]